MNRMEPLQGSYFGRPLWQYVASLLYLFLAFYVSKTIDWLIQSRLKQWAERTKTEWDDIVVDLVDGPVKTIAFVFFLHLGLAIFDWPTWLEAWVSKLTVIIVAFAIIVVFLRGVDAALGVWRKKHLSAPGERAFNDQFLLLIGKLFKAFIVDSEVRDIVKSKQLARFHTCASFDFSDYERLNGFKNIVPQYVYDYAYQLTGI